MLTLLAGGLAGAAGASELPDVGPWDRVRVDVPGWAGAEATSATGSVLLTPPPPGTPWRVEEAPVPDTYDAEEAIAALGARPWHEAGVDGTGIKVAVFDVQWFNAELYPDELGDVTTHDCQAHPSCDLPMDTLRPRYSFEEGSHGVACAEVIHDIAPGAELHLVRVNGPTTLENAAAWAIREDIDIVSMSMSFFNNSFYDGTGAVSGWPGRMAAEDTLLVGSAGNYATEHWDGPWADVDDDGDMDFPWGSSYLPVYLQEGAPSVLVSWDQFLGCGDSDFDAWVYDADGVVVGRSEERQTPGADRCEPVERIRVSAERSDWYYLRILHVGGEADAHLSIFARDGVAYAVTPGSLADPASSPSTFTVGAVRVTGYLENEAEYFSSVGPTHGGDDKPDIAGPDGLTTSIYGTYGFYGTSASTPAVAATLALAMSAEPGRTPAEAASWLQANAMDKAATWTAWDGELGAGKARLPPRDLVGGCRGDTDSAWWLAPMGLWCAAPRRRRRRCAP